MTSEIILQAIVTGLMMGLIYALIAAGLSLIFGLMEIVNFAHGEHLMLSMFSSFWLWSLFGLDPLFSIPITILLMAFCGVLTHYFLIRYILKAKSNIVIGIEKSGSKPKRDQSQKEENIESIKCSPCAKFTISINPKIKLKPAAINA